MVSLHFGLYNLYSSCYLATQAFQQERKKYEDQIEILQKQVRQLGKGAKAIDKERTERTDS